MLNIKGGPISKYVVGFFNFDASQATVYLCLQSFLYQYILMLWVPAICMAILAIMARLHASKRRAAFEVAADAVENLMSDAEGEGGERSASTSWHIHGGQKEAKDHRCGL